MRKIQVGIPVWYGVVEKDLDEFASILNKCREFGIEFVELSIDYPWPYRYLDKLYKVINIIREKCLLLGIHAPWRDIHLASPLEEIRKASVKEVVDTVKTIYKMQIMDPVYIVLHVSSSQNQLLANNRIDIIGSARKSISEIKEIVYNFFTPEKTMLCIENLSSGFTSFLQDLSEIMDDSTCLALDVAHAYISYIRNFKGYYKDFTSYLSEFIELVGKDNIAVLHFHNVSPDLREHIVPNQGVINFKEVLKIIKRTAAEYVLIEAYLDCKLKRISLHRLLELSRDFITWVKVYLTS